jgi:hypothetical protein
MKITSEYLESKQYFSDAEEGVEPYTELDRCDTINALEKDGLVLVVPEDNEIQIDLDSEEEWEEFQKRFEVFKRHFGLFIEGVKTIPSKSGLPHRHIYIEMGTKYSVMERIAFQACLGSDPTREINNMRRVFNDDIYPIALFEKA